MVLVCERVQRGEKLRSFAWMRTRCDECQALVWLKVSDLTANPKSRILCTTCAELEGVSDKPRPEDK